MEEGRNCQLPKCFYSLTIYSAVIFLNPTSVLYHMICHRIINITTRLYKENL